MKLHRLTAALLVLAWALASMGCTKDAPKRKPQQRRAVKPKPRKRAPELPRQGALAQRVLYQQAKGLLKAGRADKAVALFRRAIAAQKGKLEANCYLGLGSALSDLGRKAEAVEAFRKVVTLRPSDATAYQMLAIGLRDAGETEKAAAALEQASALEPDRLSTYQDLMTLHLEAKKTKEAQAVYARYEARRKLLLTRLKTAPAANHREDAAAALGQARDDETARGLVLALGDDNASVRMAVIRALGQQGLPVGKAPLEALLARSKHKLERKAIKLSLDAIKNAPPAPKISTAPAPASRAAKEGAGKAKGAAKAKGAGKAKVPVPKARK